jgi:hypothetical protein
MRNCDGKSHGARFGQSPKGGEAFSTPSMCDVFLLAAVALEVPCSMASLSLAGFQA